MQRFVHIVDSDFTIIGMFVIEISNYSKPNKQKKLFFLLM